MRTPKRKPSVGSDPGDQTGRAAGHGPNHCPLRACCPGLHGWSVRAHILSTCWRPVYSHGQEYPLRNRYCFTSIGLLPFIQRRIGAHRTHRASAPSPAHIAPATKCGASTRRSRSLTLRVMQASCLAPTQCPACAQVRLYLSPELRRNFGEHAYAVGSCFAGFDVCVPLPECSLVARTEWCHAP